MVATMSSLQTASRLLGWRIAHSSRCVIVYSAFRIPRSVCFSSKSPHDKIDNNNDDVVVDEDPISQWIPPDRPLVGDKGSSHLYQRHKEEDTHEEEELGEEEELRQLELELQLEDERQKQQASRVSTIVEEPVDWLQTRRSKQLEGVDMMTPDLGIIKKVLKSDVEVVQHTLLTEDEISSCLTAMGGKDISFLPNTPDRRMGAANGMMIVTGSTPAQIFLLADTLVRQLKRRDLAEVGVIGALFGAEGSDDKFDTWRVVDCSNYIVHIMDSNTRKYLNLEALWSGKDAALQVNLNDEDAMDEYVASNPVPEGYSPNSADWGASISQMERNRWIVPHRPVVARPKRKGKKRRQAGRG